jgi:hypothetical protein
MTDYILPPDLVGASVEWSLSDNTAVFQSPLSGAVRTVSRPGLRWGVRIVFRSVSGLKRRRLMSLITILRGRANRVYITDPAYTLAGSFSCPELLTNNAAVENTTGWTSSNAELVASADSHLGLRLTRTGVTADRYVYQSAKTTVTSAPYAVRMLLYAGRGNARASMEAGTSQGATDVLNGATRTANGYYVDSFSASGTSTHFSFYDYISGRSSSDFQFLSWASASRCALVNGSSQTGSKLIVDGLPTSTNGLALAGDWFEVNGELKRLTADLNSDSSGNGYLIFEPGLRTSPSDNAPVIFRSPMGKFMLASDSYAWETRPGIISDIELSLVEDIT